MEVIQEILRKKTLRKEDLVVLLNLPSEEEKLLFEYSACVKKAAVGNLVYFRGLIEFSNLCAKDCLYCGIRKSNEKLIRYNLSDDEIIQAADYAYRENYASIVLQSGELSSPAFARRITRLLKRIHQKTGSTLRVTLSLGEQTAETYREWFEAGAHRYLLRIESSNPMLYSRIHPADSRHSFAVRMRSLESLKKEGYQTGTGVMIGLPFQKPEDLAGDLLFMREFGIDMVGMGPYIEHADTPLFRHINQLLSPADRFRLTLKMIALLRIMMPEINIAAATALQAIDKVGREKAIRVGANVIMPNITPGIYRNNYKLYNNKPCTDENADDCTKCLQARVGMTGNKIAFGEWGDSQYYTARKAIY